MPKLSIQRTVWIAVGVLFLTLLPGGAPAQRVTSPFSHLLEPDHVTTHPGDPVTLEVLVRVPPGHYLYQQETTVAFDAVSWWQGGQVHYPAPTEKFDPFFKKMVALYETDLVITVTGTIAPDAHAGGQTLTARLFVQGCSENVCFRRETRPIAWTVQIVPRDGLPQGNATVDEYPLDYFPISITTPTVDTGDWRGWLAHPSIDDLVNGWWPVAFALTFVGGVLTSCTPCVLPMLPVILLIIGIRPGARRHNLFLAGALALGVATTSVAVGALAAFAGLPMAFLFQQRWFVWGLVLFFTVMALAMFGLIPVRVPQRVLGTAQRWGGRGPKGAYLAGISTGILATPCAGPVVAALVAYVGTRGDPVFGMALLGTYALGFSLLFLVVGTFYAELAQRVPKSGGLVRGAKILLGVLLLIPASYYAWVALGPTRTWQADPAQAFATAQTTHRPVLIEFTSRSCPPCLVMEHTTFRDPAVLDALAERVVPLRLDMTFPTPENDAMADRYGVIGWPAILLTDPMGTPFDDLRLLGEVVSVETLLRHIAEAERRVR
ncbi:MAG: thioredoxin family protein [Deltaproteobacteria bacterium]|nr:thioredoxin family protein [Deltaproteobacteria bacterium]